MKGEVLVEKHPINREESLRVKEKLGELIQMKLCYNNVFHVVSYNHDKFFSGEWKVAYGFVTAVDNIMARHCFVVNSDGECIDPTLAHRENKEYISFKILEMGEYFNLLMEYDGEPALYEAFIDEEKEVFQWASEEQVLLLQ